MATDDPPPAPATLSGLIATLAPTLIIAAVYISIFLVLRRSQRRYYSPRTYIGALRDSERTPPLPSGLLNWVGAFWKIPDVYALQHQSLDAYLFLRFLRIITTICFVGSCFLWPLLFPINATGGRGLQQLDMLSYSNVDTSRSSGKNRLYAHALGAWVFYGFVLYTVMRELIFYINLRQAFLLSPFYSNRISSRTVLFTSVPDQYLDEAKLRSVFGESVKTIWITGDTEKLDDLVEERDKVSMKLEKAEIKLLKLANAARIKSKGVQEESAESGSLAGRWVPAKKRPSHRLGFLGLLGKKVDSIDWCRVELERLIPETEQAQATYRAGTYKKVPGVFIEFFTQSQAEAAFQTLAHHQALQMSPKYIGITPGEVVWKSLRISWWQRTVRRFAVQAFIAALIIFWAIPVAVVGIISNVDTLKTVSFLTWLDKIPTVIMGVVTGLLPSVLLSILMSLVPVIMRVCAKLSGEPSLSRVELFTQHAYFAFQVIQVFLVATIASSATAVVKGIVDNPGSATSLLAEKIPKASNLYVSYMIVQGVLLGTGVLTQVVGFFIFSLLFKFLANTPRAMYNKWANLASISWGSVMPVYTNIAVISLCYAAIAPLVLGFATVGMSLFYLAYRYNVLFVTDTKVDTRGLIYPRALKQLLVGVYIAELCMIGLFAASAAIGPMVLMIIFMIFTALFHITINRALSPLLYCLPKTLEIQEEAMRNVHSGTSGGSAGEKGEKNGAGGAIFSTGDAAVVSGKKVGFLAKWLQPWTYCDYEVMRRLVPHDAVDVQNLYTKEMERDAYFPPSVASPTPLLWIPEDAAGISKQEIKDTNKVIRITDEGCVLTEKNKLDWDTEGVRPPIWEEKVYY